MDGIHPRRNGERDEIEERVERGPRTNPGKIRCCRPDQGVVDLRTGRISRIVYPGVTENLDKRRLEVDPEDLPGEIHRPFRVPHHLDAPRLRYIIEEPAAARLHQHRLPLHLEEGKHPPPPLGIDVVGRVPGEKCRYGFIRPPVDDQIDSSVAGLLRVAEENSERLL